MGKIEYYNFIREKINLAKKTGFEVHDNELHEILKPHQRDIVKWALSGGCRAIFASFGLGKSLMQLQTLKTIGEREGGKQLIIAPLGVRQEFTKIDGPKIGIDLKFVRKTSEVQTDGMYITNYESVRDGKLDPNIFNGISLDEAAILRSYGSKTYQEFLGLFKNVKYKFVATATPSPNRYKELIHYAGFLGICDTGQALTRYFQRDSTKANNLTLYPHKEKEFWLWVSSWALFVNKPSDLGYSDDGYNLPKLNVFWHKLKSTGDFKHDKDGQYMLFNDVSMSLSSSAKEKRENIDVRIEKMVEIINEKPNDNFILWHDQEEERKAIKRAVPSASEVYGSLDLETREQRIIDFSYGKTQYLATKPVLSGSGCNFQRYCNNSIFLGVGYKFADFIQAIHRIYRFLQEKECNIHIIYLDSESQIVKVLKEKWSNHNKMVEKMTNIIKKYGLSHTQMEAELSRTLGIERIEVSGENYKMINNDCVVESMDMESDSIGLIHTSLPFSNHYEYTPSYNDFGHTESNAHFWEQMDFLTPELYRILIPGRIAAIHIKDRIIFGNVTGCGFPTCDNMLEETSLHFQKHGFKKIGIITVVTDVVRENNQTYRLGWTEQCKDGSKMGVGCPEYVLLFRKPQTDKTRGFSDIPVVKSKEEYTRAHWQVDAHAFWRSSGNRFIGADELSSLPHDVLSRVFTKFSLDTIYDNEVHVKIGEDLDLKGKLPSTFMSIAPGSLHPQVWTDVNRMKTMNSNQSRRNVQLHVCLAEGSLVLTGEGFKPIESINIGDLVFTHKGNWKPVIAKEHTGFKEVVRTKATGVPNLVTTPTHKIWTRSGKDKYHPTRKFNDPEWKEAKDLERCYVNQKLPPVISEEILTDREWWIVGRFLADGHVGTRNDFFISVGNHKYQEFEDNVGVDFFGNKHVIGNSTQFRLKNVSSDLKAILGKCGKLAHEKQVPIEGICLNERQSEFLLAGYLSGDGHVDKHGKTHATSVSRALLLGMSIIIQRCKNKIASIYPGRKPGYKIIEGRKVNTRQDWIMLIPKDNAHHSFGKILEDGAWKRVSEIQDAGFSNVWNIRVLDDESYMAEGCIVKNCPLQIDIVDRIITRYSNKDEIIFDPFGGLGTVPLRAMKLGRKGIATELNNGYFMDACRYLQGLEIEINSPTIFDIIDEEVGE